MRRRLERQHRQHVIDVAAHRARAARPPGPDRRATHSRRSGYAAQRARTWRATRWVKSGLSMMTSTSGFAAIDGVGGLADAAQDHRQPARDGGNADDRQIVDAETGWQALRRHGVPPTPAKTTRPAARRASARISAAPSRSPDSSAATRKTCGRDAAGSSRLSGRQCRRRKSWRLSAAARPAAGSAMIVAPATTATPASPARAAAFDRRGPIAGRSKRRSCAGFGALTSTPTPAGARMRPLRAQFGDAREHAVGAFRRLDREHVAVGHDHRLPDIERSGGAQKSRARARCRLVARRRRARVPSAPSGIRISGATSCAPSMRKPWSSNNPRDAGQQMIVAAAKGAHMRGNRLKVVQSSRTCASAGRNSVPMNTTSRQPSACAPARRTARPAREEPVMRIALDRRPDRPSRAAETSRPRGRALHDRIRDRERNAAAAADDRERALSAAATARCS